MKKAVIYGVTLCVGVLALFAIISNVNVDDDSERGLTGLISKTEFNAMKRNVLRRVVNRLNK